MLGSLWNGSDVISVRNHIWSAVSHIWADFPGADASQCGDLFVSGGDFGIGKVPYSAVVLMGAQASNNFIFKLGAVAFGSCDTSTCE